ncbi:uncharacterized protein LOC117147090, partial [Drosophila mauritiana]|uniref:Uncharacterized protein LOC117147090 n=1 Tax=Drosophila mauritiana TaxID=7226 RepID=A0A6P8L2W8_DROMA
TLSVVKRLSSNTLKQSSTGIWRPRVECFIHNESSETQSGSHEKAELSQEGSQKSSEIFNLVKPINNRVEQTVKDEVFDWIKDAVRKVAEETITTKLHNDSELELQPELETKTGNEAAKPTS